MSTESISVGDTTLFGGCRAFIVALSAACAAVTGPAAAEPLLTPNRMAIVDGRPRFLVGLYENPKDDAVLSEAARAGFNLIRSGASTASLDRLHAHGVKAWVNLGGALDLSGDTEAAKQRLLKTVNAVKDHPALLIWEGPDEALWNVWYGRHLNYFAGVEFPAMRKAVEQARSGQGPTSQHARGLGRMADRCKALFDRGLWQAFDAQRAAFWKRAGTKPPRPDATMADRIAASRRLADGMTRGIEAVRQADPAHLIWLNHAPRNSIASMRLFNRAADMAGCDIYPVPENHAPGHSDLRTRRLISVGDYTERMRAAAPGKSCAMVLQGFGWRDIHDSAKKPPKEIGIGRRPNYRESRFMAFDAIVHGANAIMYWGTAYIEKDSRLWTDLLRLARELKPLEPALVAPTSQSSVEVVSDESFGSTDGGGIVAMLKQVGDDYVLIAVNETPHGLAFEVKNLPEALEGKQLHRLCTDESVLVKGRSFRDGIRGTEVHVYATSRRFEPKAKP